MADVIKNTAQTKKVSLKTNFSTPLRVNDEALELLENPVPLT